MNARLTVLSVIAGLSVAGAVYAQENVAPNTDPQVAVQAVAPVLVGNTVCPVMGEVIPADKLGMDTVEYNGKVYNVCCSMCKDKFLAEPDKFAKIAEDEVAAKAAVTPAL